MKRKKMKISRLQDPQHFLVGTESSDFRGKIPCILNEDIKIDYSRLKTLSFKGPNEDMIDLIILSGAIAFCDRNVTRHREMGWARNICLTFPVNDPKKWEDSKSQLIDVLTFLTGDVWQFFFIKRAHSYTNKKDNTSSELIIPEDKPHIVIPFSNGLDSASLLAYLSKVYPDKKIVLSTAWNHSQASSNKKWAGEQKSKAKKGEHVRISMPISLSGKKSEPTYRTRSFLFCTFAGITAHLCQAEKVMIPEGGQGLIGPSLILFGEEAPYRNMHPGFTLRMSLLFKKILNAEVKYEHPFLWQTKGQVLSYLAENNILPKDWGLTFSCFRDSRQSSYKGDRIHCGVCSNCLLRRVSIHAAGIPSSEKYLWADLNKSSFSDSCLDKDRSQKSFKDGAIAGILMMESLARIADINENNFVLQKTALQLCEDDLTKLGEYQEKLHQFLLAHKREWESFVNSLDTGSWVHEYIRGLK